MPEAPVDAHKLDDSASGSRGAGTALPSGVAHSGNNSGAFGALQYSGFGLVSTGLHGGSSGVRVSFGFG
jgi:hypothetical protein